MMKRVIGGILCTAAVLLMIRFIAEHPGESISGRLQDWGLVMVLLLIGIPLSTSKKGKLKTD